VTGAGSGIGEAAALALAREGAAVALSGRRRKPLQAVADRIVQAGGKALVAPGKRILDVQPKAIHERTPVILGGADEVDHVAAQLG